MSASVAAVSGVSASKASGLSLRRNFAWTLAGNIAYAGSQWGMLVILAKMGTPQRVGEFALGLAVAGPVMMFCNLALRTVLASDMNSRSHFGTYVSLRLTTTACALSIIALIGLCAGYRGETLGVVLGVGLAKAFESLSDLIYGLLQQHERMDWIARSMMIKGPLSLLAFGMAILLTHNLVYAVLALAVAWASLLAGYDVRNAIRVLRDCGDLCNASGILKPRWSAKDMKPLALTALPLAFAVMLISLTGNFPRYFIERYDGAAQLGIFAAMAYLPVVGTTLTSALAESSLPRLAKYYALGNIPAFRRLTFKLVAIGAILGVLGLLAVVFFGREMLTILYRPEYAEHTDVFIWLMIGAGVGYVGAFLGTMMTATRAFKNFVFPYVVFTLISAASCWLLIARFGIEGAAWATCVTAAASVIVPLAVFAAVRQKGKVWAGYTTY